MMKSLAIVCLPGSGMGLSFSPKLADDEYPVLALNRSTSSQCDNNTLMSLIAQDPSTWTNELDHPPMRESF